MNEVKILNVPCSCSKCCARQGTEAHSGPVSASLVVADILAGRVVPSGARSTRLLTDADLAAMAVVAEEIAQQVDASLIAKAGSAGKVV